MIRLLSAFGALLIALSVAWVAHAQDAPQRSPFSVPAAPGQSAAAPKAVERNVMTDAWSWLLAQQQRINREMAAAVREMKSGSVLNASLILAFLGFTYGVLHAAGPGHGKAVISSYVLANDETVRRGILLSFLAAFIQALSAIFIVGVLALLLNATSLQINAAEAWIETISWGFVALIGIWLLYGQISGIVQRRRAAAAAKAAEAEKHAHSHAHEHGSCGCGHDHGHAHAHDHSYAHAHGSSHSHQHDDTHVHAADGSCCGHAHMPDPSQLKGPMSWSKALAIAFSVGIRPCTGAILIMVFALSQGLLIAGVFATFAMALGTAITVSALAALAVGSRDLATRIAGPDSRFASVVGTGAGLAGSALVFLLGATFFLGSLSATGRSPL